MTIIAADKDYSAVLSALPQCHINNEGNIGKLVENRYLIYFFVLMKNFHLFSLKFNYAIFFNADVLWEIDDGGVPDQLLTSEVHSLKGGSGTASEPQRMMGSSAER